MYFHDLMRINGFANILNEKPDAINKVFDNSGKLYL